MSVLRFWHFSVVIFLLLLPIGLLHAEEKEPAVAVTQTAFAAPDTTASLVKVSIGLAFVVLAIFASAWLFRRFGRGPFLSHNAMHVVGGLSMGQRERVVLLQVGNEQILLGVSPGRIQTLHVLSEPIETTETDQGKENFSEKFNHALKQWKKS